MKRVQTLRDRVPACPKCGSQSMAVTLLTYYNVSIRCSDCDNRWTISQEDVAAMSVQIHQAVSEHR
jgi:transcription elongation factor Elf1